MNMLDLKQKKVIIIEICWRKSVFLLPIFQYSDIQITLFALQNNKQKAPFLPPAPEDYEQVINSLLLGLIQKHLEELLNIVPL